MRDPAPNLNKSSQLFDFGRRYCPIRTGNTNDNLPTAAFSAAPINSILLFIPVYWLGYEVATLNTHVESVFHHGEARIVVDGILKHFLFSLIRESSIKATIAPNLSVITAEIIQEKVRSVHLRRQGIEQVSHNIRLHMVIIRVRCQTVTHLRAKACIKSASFLLILLGQLASYVPKSQQLRLIPP